MNEEFIYAIEDLEREKQISKELLIEAIESALVSAYKKNYGTSQNVRVNIDKQTGDIDVFMRKDVVMEVSDPFVEVSLEEAKEVDPLYEIDDIVEYRVTPKDFGRIAAQTAKQVVVQRIREAERSMIYDDFISRKGEVTTGIIHRINNETVFVNIGKAEAMLPVKEQVRGEEYVVNSRIKVYIMDVKKTTKGPQVCLSRSHPHLVKGLFELEVPEIREGIVEIKSIAREAGSRTKISVYTEDENIDAVGTCVGPRGSRVTAIVDELFDEKIDIINHREEPEELIKNSLSPSKVEEVFLDEENKTALVVVPDYQLSLAIGREGQNVRLAAKLTAWKIDIKSHSEYYKDEALDDEASEEIQNELQEEVQEEINIEAQSDAQDEIQEEHDDLKDESQDETESDIHNENEEQD